MVGFASYVESGFELESRYRLGSARAVVAVGIILRVSGSLEEALQSLYILAAVALLQAGCLDEFGLLSGKYGFYLVGYGSREFLETRALRNHQAEENQHPGRTDEYPHEDTTFAKIVPPVVDFVVVEGAVQRRVEGSLVAEGVVEGFQHLLVEAWLGELASLFGIGAGVEHRFDAQEYKSRQYHNREEPDYVRPEEFHQQFHQTSRNDTNNQRNNATADIKPQPYHCTYHQTEYPHPSSHIHFAYFHHGGVDDREHQHGKQDKHWDKGEKHRAYSLEHAPDTESPNLPLAVGKNAVGFVLSLVETLHVRDVFIDFPKIFQIILQETLVGELRAQVGVGIFLMMHREEATETALVVFRLKGIFIFREHSVEISIGFSGIQAGIFRRGAESLYYLHPGGLGAEEVVLGTGLLDIVVGIAVGAVHEPLALLLETVSLCVERLRHVMIVFRGQEVHGYGHHRAHWNSPVLRSIAFVAPDRCHLGHIASADIPEYVVDLVQQPSQSLACHGIVGVGRVVDQVDVRQRVYLLHTEHEHIGRLSGNGQPRSNVLAAHTHPLLEYISPHKLSRRGIGHCRVEEITYVLKRYRTGVHRLSRLP